jgi:hypothetical protein
MNRHQSPHRPGDGDLTALRRRQTRKENGMKRTIAQGLIGVAMLGTAIAGIALVDASGGPTTKVSGYADPTCGLDAFNVYQCVGSPEASPAPQVTPLPTIAPTMATEPTPTLTAREEVETITELPGTGTGSSQ